MNLTPSILMRCMPLAPPETCVVWAPAFDAAAKEFGIDGHEMAAWLASMSNETGQLTEFRELWRYSPERAAEIYGLSAEETARYQQSREVWFEFVYGHTGARGRMLGNDQPGDGGKYYGMGPIQLTGKSNYRHVGDGIGVDLVGHPEKILEPETGARAAAFYFVSNGIDKLAADGTEQGFRRAVKKMNSGLQDFTPHVARWHEVRRGLRIDASGNPDAPDGRAVQAALNAWLRSIELDEDGIIGPKSRAVIRLFQYANAMRVTGAPDETTRRKMGLPT